MDCGCRDVILTLIKANAENKKQFIRLCEQMDLMTEKHNLFVKDTQKVAGDFAKLSRLLTSRMNKIEGQDCDHE